MYTTNNVTIYSAAFEGAIMGMAAQNRQPIDPNAADSQSVTPANVAGAWAQEFDTLWGIPIPTDLELENIRLASFGVWANRQPGAVGANVKPSNFAALVDGIIALIDAADAYFAWQGIPIVPTPLDVLPFTEIIAVAGGASNSFPVTAGTTVAKFAVDTTNAAPTIVLDSAMVNFSISVIAGANPVNVTAPTGKTIFNPATGTFTAAAGTASLPGGAGTEATWNLDATNARYIQVGS